MGQSDLSFKHKDAASYNAVVDLFDGFSQRFTTNVTDRMCEMLDFPRDPDVLDIGTGTGIVANHVAGIAGPGARVLGVDLSEGMLAFAHQKLNPGPTRDSIDFLRMDAEQLACGNGVFDNVLSLYALPHFPHPDRALSEMYRVLKPGGTLVVGVGAGPRPLSPEGLLAAFRKILGLARGAAGRELRACEFLDQLVRDFIPQGEHEEHTHWSGHGLQAGKALPQLVEAAGFSQVRTKWAGQVSVIESIEEFYQLQMTFSSLARKRLEGADDATAGQLRAAFDERCEKVQRRGGRLIYQSGAMLVSGRKPGTARAP